MVLGRVDDGLREALRAAQPRALELIGEDHDLTKLAGVVASVRSLRVEGEPGKGCIRKLTGLAVFENLESLDIVSAVDEGCDGSGLGRLTRCTFSWQPLAHTLLGLPSLRSATIRSLPGQDAKLLPTDASLTSLWLDRPELESLAGMERLPHLTDLRLTQARRLGSCAGASALSGLVRLDIEKARALVDIGALAGLPGLQDLRLVEIGPSTDLEPITHVKSLRRVHVGGPKVPALPWAALVAAPCAEWLSGWWNPSELPEAAMRAAVPAGRRLIRFDPVGRRAPRPLVVELA